MGLGPNVTTGPTGLNRKGTSPIGIETGKRNNAIIYYVGFTNSKFSLFVKILLFDCKGPLFHFIRFIYLSTA